MLENVTNDDGAPDAAVQVHGDHDSYQARGIHFAIQGDDAVVLQEESGYDAGSGDVTPGAFGEKRCAPPSSAYTDTWSHTLISYSLYACRRRGSTLTDEERRARRCVVDRLFTPLYSAGVCTTPVSLRLRWHGVVQLRIAKLLASVVV